VVKINTKFLAIITTVLCAACCLAVPALVILGVAGAVGLAGYFEFAALGFFTLTVLLLAYAHHKKHCIACGPGCCSKN